MVYLDLKVGVDRKDLTAYVNSFSTETVLVSEKCGNGLGTSCKTERKYNAVESD